MSLAPILVAAPVLAASIFAAVWTASQAFQSNYMETLCRMESVRTHAIENIENGEPIEANFGGDECIPEVLPPDGMSEENPTPTPGPSVAPAEALLSQALLTLEDMPVGWTAGPRVDTNGTGELSLCGVPAQYSPSAQVDAGFQQSDIGPFVGQVVQAFAPGEAEGAIADGRAATQSCGAWTETNEDGTQTQWQVSMLAFPQIGDETLALRLSAEGAPYGIVTMDLVYVRRGDYLTGVAHSVWGYVVDSDRTATLVNRADEKLAALP
jgi:hypothetical protein